MLCPGDIVVADMRDDEGVMFYATSELARKHTHVGQGFKIGTIIATHTRPDALAPNDALLVLDSTTGRLGWVYACNVKPLSAKPPSEVVE